jgi:hypothetical protein
LQTSFFFSSFFDVLKNVFFCFTSTVSGCDGRNRIRNLAVYIWCFSPLSYNRHPNWATTITPWATTVTHWATTITHWATTVTQHCRHPVCLECPEGLACAGWLEHWSIWVFPT